MTNPDREAFYELRKFRASLDSMNEGAHVCPGWDCHHTKRILDELFASGVLTAERAANQTAWVAVSERLPDQWSMVLAWDERRGYSLARWLARDDFPDGRTWSVNGSSGANVDAPTQWMPLPAADALGSDDPKPANQTDKAQPEPFREKFCECIGKLMVVRAALDRLEAVVAAMSPPTRAKDIPEDALKGAREALAITAAPVAAADYTDPLLRDEPPEVKR
jgi:hypothetical protein